MIEKCLRYKLKRVVFILTNIYVLYKLFLCIVLDFMTPIINNLYIQSIMFHSQVKNM